MLNNIGYSRKRSRLYDKNKLKSTNNLLKLKKIERFLFLFNNGYHFLFIDEVSTTTNIYPNYGYSPKYEKFLVKKGYTAKNISMVVAIGVDSVEGFQIFDGSIKS